MGVHLLGLEEGGYSRWDWRREDPAADGACVEACLAKVGCRLVCRQQLDCCLLNKVIVDGIGYFNYIQDCVYT